MNDALADFDRIKDPSTFIYGLFIDDEWGGPNELYLLSDGRIWILGHIAGFGDESYTTPDGKKEAKKDYHPVAFIFDPKTKSVSNIHIIATTEQFPPVEPKEEKFGKILYSGGLVRRGDGYA